MISRRDLLTWWRRRPMPEPLRPPAPARVVEPVRIDDPAPFSLEGFYEARAAERRR